MSQGLTLGPALNSQKTLLLVFSFFFTLAPFFFVLRGLGITNDKRGFLEGGKIVTPPCPHVSEVPGLLLQSLGLYFLSDTNHLLGNSRT